MSELEVLQGVCQYLFDRGVLGEVVYGGSLSSDYDGERSTYVLVTRRKTRIAISVEDGTMVSIVGYRVAPPGFRRFVVDVADPGSLQMVFERVMSREFR